MAARRVCLTWPEAILLAALCLAWGGWASGGAGRGPFDWMGHDTFDDITDEMDSITEDNCRSKSLRDLWLPSEVLAQMPRFNKLHSTMTSPNRTDVLHLHNMALNRAFFYSYILQTLDRSEDFQYQPGLMYYYLSTAADISANGKNVMGSAVLYDSNCAYANWYRSLPFNVTLPLFGPKSWRFDDNSDPAYWGTEAPDETLGTTDYGAGPLRNYTLQSNNVNQVYDLWLPDGWDRAGYDSVRKQTYDISIKYSNEAGRFTDDQWVVRTFTGPPSPRQKYTEHMPVFYTEPFFDCGRTNKWLVSAVSPVVDHLPRYVGYVHLKRYRFVAVTAMDMEFSSIDLNPCPLGIGNEMPNYFRGTARCKDTTTCEPLPGWGLRRGGYQCVCKPGYFYPPGQKGPFAGSQIEIATEKEYNEGFQCTVADQFGNETATPVNVRKKREQEVVMTENTRPEFVKRTDRAADSVDASVKQSRILNQQRRFLRMVGLVEVDKVTDSRKKRAIVQGTKADNRKSRYAPRYKRDTAKIRNKRNAFIQEAYDQMMAIIQHKESVNKDTCNDFREDKLELSGDVSYGVEKKFSYQARTALRLSHFLSSFLQNIDMFEDYGSLRGDNLLNIEQLFGEVIANVMGDLKIKGSGIFYDMDKFVGPDGVTRQFFGPYAYRYLPDDTGGPEGDQANTHIRAVDYAGFETHYLDRPWFKSVKERWQSSTYGLTKFTEKPMVRSGITGTNLEEFPLYPLYYWAPKEEDGWWSAPYFDCGNEEHVNDWIITYAVPFFGLNSTSSSLEFKGVAIVDVKLDDLNIDQCPMDFHVPNAFANTARCQFDTASCESLPAALGNMFQPGRYKCECLEGWEFPFNDTAEYPFNDEARYFNAQTMEEEYDKMMAGEDNIYEELKCRYTPIPDPEPDPDPSGASTVVVSWLLAVAILLAVWSKNA